MVLRLLGPLLVLALAACGSVATRQNEVRIQPNERVVLQEVRFDYEQWSSQDPDFLQEAKARESEWAALIRQGYEEASQENGLGRNTGPEVPLTIAVTDLEPGSGVMRNLLFSRSGRGLVEVLATVEGRGSLVAGGSVESNDTHGSLGGILEDVGGAVADGIMGR